MYGPSDPTERKEFLKTVKFWIARNTDYPEHVIMGGNFNCGLNTNDRSNTDEDPTRAALRGPPGLDDCSISQCLKSPIRAPLN